MPPSKQNKRFKRPSGWRHVTGYRKYIQPTARCGKCNEKCKIENPFRKCRKCAFHICWQCEQNAGGPSHNSVECNIKEPLPTGCSDTTDSDEGDSRNPVYRWAGDARAPTADQRTKHSRSATKKFNNSKPNKNTNMVEQNMEDVDANGKEEASLKTGSSPKEIKTNSSSQQLSRGIVKPWSDSSVISSTSDKSYGSDGLGACLGLSETERELYVARKPLLKKFDLWVEPLYVPPGMVPGAIQRRLLYASPRELEEFAKIKQECFFHTLDRTAPKGYHSYSDIPSVPAYSSYPQASLQYWPIEKSQGLTAVEDKSVAYQAEPSPRPMERRIQRIEVLSSAYSDTDIDEDFGTRKSAYDSSCRLESKKRKGSYLGQSLFKRHRPDIHKEPFIETAKPSSHVLPLHAARQTPQRVQSTSSASNALEIGCDEDEGNMEVDQPRAFGRGRGRLDVSTRTSGLEQTVSRKPNAMHQPQPQKHASRILGDHQHGSSYSGWATGTEEPSHSVYQAPMRDCRRGLAARDLEANFSSCLSMHGTGRRFPAQEYHTIPRDTPHAVDRLARQANAEREEARNKQMDRIFAAPRRN